MKKGDQFSHQFLVTDKIYNGFIELFNDRNPLHTDAQFSSAKGFKSEVMHGNILGGFISYFIGEGLPIKNVIIHSQEIKYFKPVYRDTPLLFSAVIEEMHESMGVIEFKFIFEDQDRQKLAKGRIQIGII